MASQLTSLSFFLLLGFAALTAFRMAIAETISRQDTVESVRRAIACQGTAPASEFEERLAELDPANARASLERAVAINPYRSTAWISLGILEETAGNPAAERSLLHAAQIDHQYLPAWTLSNYYFRQGNADSFWDWAVRAASLAHNDFRPLFRLCDRFERDPHRLLTHFKEIARLKPQYLDFLIGENRLDAAEEVAREMSGDRENDPHLIDLADRQLRAGNYASATEMWNISSGFEPLEPASGRILTNGDLARAPSNLGFDWHLRPVEGVAEDWKPSELAFTLSGSQPGNCILLEQTICLIARHVRLRFDYMTNAPPVSGIRWSLDGFDGPPIEPSPKWAEAAFDLPRSRGISHLYLLYRRDPGAVPAAGEIKIRHLRLHQG